MCECLKDRESREGKVCRTWIYPLHAIGIDEVVGRSKVRGNAQTVSIL